MCFPKHHRRRTPDAETGENRPLPRQLPRGVEHVLRWCDRQVQGPDVSHKICGNDTNLPSNITLVKSNLQKTCSKSQNSKSNNVRPMCFPKHHRRRTPDAETGENRPLPRQLRRGVEHVLRWCDRQVQGPDVSHKICGNDTNLPSNITLVKSNLQKTCSKSQNSKSNNVRPMCFPKHHRRRTPDAETGENRPLPRQLRRGVEHVLRWCDRQVQGPDVSHKICGNDTNLPSNITLVKSNLQKTCSKLQNPKSNNVRPMCFPKHHRRRTPDAETGENRPLPRQLRRGVEHVLRWCDRQVQGPDVSHKICGNDTNLPSNITLVKSNLQKTCSKLQNPKSNNVRPMCFPKHHRRRTPDAETGENRPLPRQLPRGGACFTMV